MRGTIVVLAGLLTAMLGEQSAFALGTEEFGAMPLGEANYKEWPGLIRVINDPNRVYSSWVNGHERMLFDGDMAALNAALKEFAKAELKSHRVQLRCGPRESHSFDRSYTYEPHWELEIFGGISKHVVKQSEGARVWPVDPLFIVNVDDGTKLNELIVPPEVTVVSATQALQDVVAAMDRSTDQTVRGWGCSRVVELDRHSEAGLNAVAARLKDPVDWVKLNAAGVIAEYGAAAKPHLDVLREVAQSTDDQLAKRAKESIEKISSAVDNRVEREQHQQRSEAIAKFARDRAEKLKPVP